MTTTTREAFSITLALASTSLRRKSSCTDMASWKASSMSTSSTSSTGASASMPSTNASSPLERSTSGVRNEASSAARTM